MGELRERLRVQMQAPVVRLPYQQDVDRLMVLNPCALVAAGGGPVSLWHVGTVNASAASSVSPEALRGWSCGVFEYVDLWLTELSESTGHLAGHIQIFSLTGMSFWHVSNSALLEKLKLAFSAGEFYLEAVSHIYIVNSSSLFSMAWSLVKGLISPRTAAKVSVDSGVPPELLAALTADSAAKLRQMLKSPQPTWPVMRPMPRRESRTCGVCRVVEVFRAS